MTFIFARRASMVGIITFLYQTVFIVLTVTLLAVPATVWAKVGVGDSPNLEFTTVSGVNVDEQYLKGKLVIVDFWASWCSHCVSAIPHMKNLHAEYGSQDIEILGVNSDRTKETMLKFVADQKLDWLQYYDQGSKLGRLWGIPGIPTLFLLSPNGNVLWTGNPAQLNWSLAKAMKKYLEKGEMLDKLKKRTVQALSDADKALKAADYTKMLKAFKNMDSGAVEDKDILKICESLFSKLKMIKDKGTVQKIQAAIKAEKEDGRAYVDMLVAIDEALRVKVGEHPE